MPAVPEKSLRSIDIFCLVVGTIVGAGIFKAPSIVAANAGSIIEFLLVWLVGGFLSIVGALCYVELSTAYPSTGGEYHFLSRSFGKKVAFLYGWSRTVVIIPGSMAILAITFGDYLSVAFSLGANSNVISAVALILLLSLVNIVGLTAGKWLQNALTVVEMAGMVAVVIVGVLVSDASMTMEKLTHSTKPTDYGMAMVFVLLSFGGWSEAAYVSAEAKDERNGIKRAMVLGLVAVTVMYFLINLVYVQVLGLDGVAKSNAAAFDLFSIVFGSATAVIFGLIVCFSCVNSINATIIFGARSGYSIGRAHRTFRWLGQWSVSGNPTNSILLQCLATCLLIALSAVTEQAFKALVEFTAPVFWFFVLLVGVSLIVQRIRDPHIERPFKVPFYPVFPLVFIAATSWLLISSLSYAGSSAWIGLAVLLAGCIPLVLESVDDENKSQPRGYDVQGEVAVHASAAENLK